MADVRSRLRPGHVSCHLIDEKETLDPAKSATKRTQGCDTDMKLHSVHSAVCEPVEQLVWPLEGIRMAHREGHRCSSACIKEVEDR